MKIQRMNAEELDDVATTKPQPMDEDLVIRILQGHKFKFALDNY